MAQLTRLPARQLADFAQILQKSRYDDTDLPVLQLLHVLRAHFEQEEADLSGKLLYYKDADIKTQIASSRVHFVLPTTHDSPKGQQCNHPPKRVFPPTPAKPSPTELAKLLDVSYTEWSDPTSYEDTTGDSKLAEWLASFGETQQNWSKENTVSSSKEISYNIISRQTVLRNESPPKQFILPAVQSPNASGDSLDSSPYKRHRAVSDPSSLSRISPARSRSMSASDGDSHKPRLCPGGTPIHSPHDSLVMSKPFQMIQTPIFSPFRLGFQPLDLKQDSLIPASPVTPASFYFDHGLVQTPRTPLPSTPLHKIAYYDDVDDGTFKDLSTGIPPDVSGVHAFNLSLQHTAKSPSLIRGWRRMIGELTGRFPFSLGDPAGRHRPMNLLTEREEFVGALAEESALSEDKLETTGYETKEQEEGFVVENVSPTKSPANYKTHADVLLDREYAAHLRANIAKKREEVRVLHDLIAYREQTIARMEMALKERALDVLGGH